MFQVLAVLFVSLGFVEIYLRSIIEDNPILFSTLYSPFVKLLIFHDSQRIVLPIAHTLQSIRPSQIDLLVEYAHVFELLQAQILIETLID